MDIGESGWFFAGLFLGVLGGVFLGAWLAFVVQEEETHLYD